MNVQGWFLSRIKLPFLVEKRWPNCSYSRQLCCVGSWIFFPSSRSATRHAVCTESVRFCRHIRSSISGHTFFLSPSSAVCHIKAATSVTTLHYAEHFCRLDISHSQSVRQADSSHTARQSSSSSPLPPPPSSWPPIAGVAKTEMSPATNEP